MQTETASDNQRAALVQPFIFLGNRSDQGGPSFEEFKAKKNFVQDAVAPVTHPTMTADVPDERD